VNIAGGDSPKSAKMAFRCSAEICMAACMAGRPAVIPNHRMEDYCACRSYTFLRETVADVRGQPRLTHPCSPPYVSHDLMNERQTLVEKTPLLAQNLEVY
jgi:hypothetical protein